MSSTSAVLEDIILTKQNEIKKNKQLLPLDIIKKAPFPEIYDFKVAIKKQQGISIIAEIKHKSPSSGIIIEDFNPVKIAQIYQENGADAISVLTDKKFFGGSPEHLTAVKKSVTVPVLRKEFIIDEYQIYESRYIGADAILLISRILTTKQLQRFISISQELGLTSIVEVHTKEELESVLSTPVEIIGINNRDLDTLRVNLDVSFTLRKLIPPKYIVVSESGIKTNDDITKLEAAHFDAVLVGETILRAKNIGNKLRTLRSKKSYL